MVVLVIAKMNGAATLLAPGGDDSFVDVGTVHSLAAKAREQRGVDVDDPPGHVVWDSPELQKARHANQIDVGDCVGELLLKGVRVESSPFDYDGWEVGTVGALDSCDVFARADDGLDFCVELSVGDAVVNVLERSSAA